MRRRRSTVTRTRRPNGFLFPEMEIVSEPEERAISVKALVDLASTIAATTATPASTSADGEGAADEEHDDIDDDETESDEASQLENQRLLDQYRAKLQAYAKGGAEQLTEADFKPNQRKLDRYFAHFESITHNEPNQVLRYESVVARCNAHLIE